MSSEDVEAAKAFLSELPLGIASPSGIAAVRTLLASHQMLEASLRSGVTAAGGDRSETPASIIDGLLARVATLKEALEARGAEAIVLKDRNALTEARLQEAIEDARRREIAAASLEEEKQRSARAESGLRRAEERLREAEAEVANLGRRVAELVDLAAASNAEVERQTKRADAAEAAVRAGNEALAEKDAALDVLRSRIAEAIDAASWQTEAMERKITAATAAMSSRDAELADISGQLLLQRERTEDLRRSGEAQASHAAAQQQLAESLRRELDARQRELKALAEEAESVRLELRAAKVRAHDLQDVLLPFAEMAESYDLADAGWVVDSGWCEDRKHRIVVADFRAARSVAFGETSGSGTPLAPDLVSEPAIAPSEATIAPPGE